MADDDDDKGSFVNRKVMISAIFSLFAVMVLIILLHLYSRYLQRRRERRQARASLYRMSSQIAPEVVDFSIGQPKAGLDPSIVAIIPAFKYYPKDHLDCGDQGVDCSVCLSTVVEDAMVRMLPNCKHMFHVECIDMWLESHDTCPVCRTLAEPTATEPEERVVVRQPPSAPPLQEGNSSANGAEMEKGSGSSGSRFGSFRWMVSRDRSSRARSCGEEIYVQEDLERQ